RETLYNQVKGDYESGAFDGEAATFALTGTVYLSPLENPRVTEDADSTDRDRRYTLHLPAGAIRYATFFIDLTTGQLCMATPPDYEGPTFAINESGELEVHVNG
ncbi:hypothetical protein LJC74_06940, partial [Eubacteriales bacterium OttesenSCG-928-A19]|nr:hypothetical protein [Eubacteriales bacterium OttesenSCG-928-A19]